MKRCGGWMSYESSLIGYLRLIARHPAALKRWVTTLSLLIAHMQVLLPLPSRCCGPSPWVLNPPPPLAHAFTCRPSRR